MLIIVLIILLLKHSIQLITFAQIPYCSSVSCHKNVVIYRTSRSRYTNLKVYNNCYRKWMELNPSATMIWFDDLDCKRYMRKQPREVYDAYQRLRPGAFKADLFRLCLLYEKGGVYVDCEATPYVSLREMMSGIELPRDRMFIAPLDRRGIHNGFMIASPRHPFLASCIQYIVDNVKNERYYNDDLAITGPVALSRSINRFLGRDDESPFHTGLNRFCDISMYLYQYRNFLPQGPFQYIYRDNKCLVAKKHCVYSYLRAKLNPSAYFRMVKARQVYLPSN